MIIFFAGVGESLYPFHSDISHHVAPTYEFLPHHKELSWLHSRDFPNPWDRICRILIAENNYENSIKNYIFDKAYYPLIKFLAIAVRTIVTNSRPWCTTLSSETLSGETIHRAKFSLPNETFRPLKVKVSLNEVQVNLRRKEVI